MTACQSPPDSGCQVHVGRLPEPDAPDVLAALWVVACVVDEDWTADVGEDGTAYVGAEDDATAGAGAGGASIRANVSRYAISSARVALRVAPWRFRTFQRTMSRPAARLPNLATTSWRRWLAWWVRESAEATPGTARAHATDANSVIRRMILHSFAIGAARHLATPGLRRGGEIKLPRPAALSRKRGGDLRYQRPTRRWVS